MIRQVLSFMSYSFFAEAALVLFSLIFIAIVIRTLWTKSEITTKHAGIVFDDNRENLQ